MSDFLKLNVENNMFIYAKKINQILIFLLSSLLNIQILNRKFSHYFILYDFT